MPVPLLAMESGESESLMSPKQGNPQQVFLPQRKTHRTPRLLMADAYTLGSGKFQAPVAQEKSIYYLAFRRALNDVDPELYAGDDERIVFCGLQRILERLFYEPVSHAEIDETLRFLARFKATSQGLRRYHFDETLWRRVVDEFQGRPPIRIEALPEGSVAYPHEPVIQVSSLVAGMGELAAWFESKIVQVWSTTERATRGRHWFKYLTEMIAEVDPALDREERYFLAATLTHDFGDRGGICAQESEELGMTHLYSFSGSDTLAGAYQAWKNSGEQAGAASSVAALAHRSVQPWLREGDSYRSIYDAADNGDFISMVADCYDYFAAVDNYLLPLALESAAASNGKIVVARPDSGDPLDCVLYVCNLAIAHGLYTEYHGYKYPTTLKCIQGDGMSFAVMKHIFEELKQRRLAPHAWLLFGVGGGLRNHLQRDHLGAKYALCAVGKQDRPVIKLSETPGKSTLPGPFKLRRGESYLRSATTIALAAEAGDNALIEYFNGARVERPFGPGQDDDFGIIRQRIQDGFDAMPPRMPLPEKAYPASELVLRQRKAEEEARRHS